METANKLRIGLIICAAILIASHLFTMDYNNLSWENNSASYLGIIGMILLILSMLFSMKHSKKRKEKNV
jgi:hypothetical protein